MKTKKNNALALNKKVISKLNQLSITGGEYYEDSTIDEVTGLVICTNAPHSKGSCNCTTYPTSFPPTAGTNTTTDMATRRGCA
nr:hypothetical protein [uncultured Chryseobacterium sp.]